MRAILMSARIQMEQSIARPMFRFCVFISPILSGILLGMIYQNRSIEDFMLYAFIGAGISTFWGSICFSSASDMDREKWLGTMPMIFTSPIGFENIIFGKILGNTLWGIFSFGLNMLTVKILFNKSIQFASFNYFLLITILMIISMIAVGFMMAGLFTLSRKISLLMNVIDYPIIILTGMVFPISIFPKFIQYISYLLSPTWAMQGYKLAIQGGSAEQLQKVALILVFVTVVYFIVSIVSFRKIKKLCVINGTLEVF
ncbi:ABC transporter permease [Gemella cuniculi]|uniref:ABC transporter permease n=1 Tax=Gemella cuniculi TaxID=150240 RepID=UPI0004269020|nr:ABC transporter permease [Gemella cuniculi]